MLRHLGIRILTHCSVEPIKWPELNTHGENLNYALPTNRATDAGAGAGVGTALDSASEVNLNRNLSNVGYSASQYSQPSTYGNASAADSTADLYAPGGDPYAVPPLPHLNPSTPYRDDPSGFGGNAYYDPYRGPIPNTFNDAASVDLHAQGEAIPMSNLSAPGGASRGPSPTPGMGPMSPVSGRQSPGPGYAYGGRASPGPAPMMGGRQSPGPGAAYGPRY